MQWSGSYIRRTLHPHNVSTQTRRISLQLDALWENGQSGQVCEAYSDVALHFRRGLSGSKSETAPAVTKNSGNDGDSWLVSRRHDLCCHKLFVRVVDTPHQQLFYSDVIFFTGTVGSHQEGTCQSRSGKGSYFRCMLHSIMFMRSINMCVVQDLATRKVDP